jgi:hypothetical protein
MLIAIDYDDTYTQDPFMWDAFIKLAKSQKHGVICVTMRHEHEGSDVIRQLHGKVDSILFTARRAKLPYTFELGYRVSVWIDDSPHFVLQDAAGAVTALDSGTVETK